MLHLDFETYSRCDIRKEGVYKYAEHHSTEVLLAGFAYDNHPVNVIDFTKLDSRMYEYFLELLQDTTIKICAHNAQFERLILRRFFMPDVDLFPAERFRCTQAMAYHLGLTGSLDACCSQIGMDYGKQEDGPILIRRFCMPQPTNHNKRRWHAHDDPDGWARFRVYCMQDVEAERTLGDRCLEVMGSDRPDWGLYVIDQQVNDAGLPVDMRLVEEANRALTVEKDRLMCELRQLTGLNNPTSNKQFREWWNSGVWPGYTLPDLRKATVAAMLARFDEPDFPTGKFDALKAGKFDALKLYADSSRSSTAKWRTIERVTGLDHTMRGCFQFRGASRTGRWAGRLFQPQNLPRPTPGIDVEESTDLIRLGIVNIDDNVMDRLSSTVRSAVCAPEGQRLIVADWSSIEARLAGWLTDCSAMNNAFSLDLDIYQDLASEIFEKDYEQVTEGERNLAKPAALGCQYMLSGYGLMKYAANFGVELKFKEAMKHVDAYRALYPEIVTGWREIKEAFEYVLSPDGQNVKMFKDRIALSRNREGWVRVRLPSERFIYYKDVKILPHEITYVNREGQWETSEIESISFMGKNQFTTKWERLFAHPGHLFENFIQAMAADVLGTALGRYPGTVVGHVHDEIIAMAPREQAGFEEMALSEAMTYAAGDWPSPGPKLPVKSYIAKRFRK